MCASSEGPGETVWLRRLVQAFAACMHDYKDQCLVSIVDLDTFIEHVEQRRVIYYDLTKQFTRKLNFPLLTFFGILCRAVHRLINTVLNKTKDA